MVIKIIQGNTTTLEECDTFKLSEFDGTLTVRMFSNRKGYEGSCGKTHTFTKGEDKAKIFVMENGKTVDRIDFM